MFLEFDLDGRKQMKYAACSACGRVLIFSTVHVRFQNYPDTYGSLLRVGERTRERGWPDCRLLAFVAGAKRGGGGGREKGKREGSPLSLSPIPSLFPFFPIPYPFRRLLCRLVDCPFPCRSVGTFPASFHVAYRKTIERYQHSYHHFLYKHVSTSLLLKNSS